MRQGSFNMALIGALAVSLLAGQSWAELDVSSKARRAGSSSQSRTGDVQPVQNAFHPITVVSSPSAAGGDELQVVFDNGFDGPFDPAGAGGANQYQDFDPATGFNVIGVMADDVTLPAGTVIRGAKQRFFFSAAGGGLIGAIVTFWEDAGGAPSNTILDQFIVEDPGVQDQDATGDFFEVIFPGEEAHVMSGNLEWVSVTPVQLFPPQTFSFDVPAALGESSAWISFQPADPLNPWSDGAPTDDGADINFALLGIAANGGTTIATFEGSGQGGCDIRITPTTADSGCAPEAGPCERSFGNGCFATSGAAPFPAVTVLGIANALDGANCAPELLDAVAIGPYLILTTDDGPRPDICVEQVSGAVTQLGTIGGGCRVAACGHDIGIGAADTLPNIPGDDGGDIGDRLTTSKTCDSTETGGTFQRLELGAGALDLAGLPVSDPISQLVNMAGVARDFATDDSDTRVERRDDIVFGRCSGDFSRAGAENGVFGPDGAVDELDLAQFDFCQNNPGAGDCGRFDFDGDGSISGDLNAAPGQGSGDAATLLCLQLSSDSAQCCPSNTTLPQEASSPIRTNLTRLHLRGCDYLEVTRSGQIWPENWIVDSYLSPIAPRIGVGAGGNCIADADAEVNDVIETAVGIGLVSTDSPVTVAGEIGNSANCDDGIGFTGDNDGDLYRFSLAFSNAVSISVAAQGGLGDCSPGGTPALVSVWLFDEAGVLVDSQDNGLGGDPSLNSSLDSGVYYVLVAGAGLVGAPDATSVTGCSIGSGQGPELFDPNIGIPLDVTGVYELSLSIAQQSTMTVTQIALDANTGLSGGEFDSTLLVQPLITLQRVCDPFQAVLIDTGELGMDAVILEATGSPYVRSLSTELADVLMPEDTGFIPGVREDAGGNQTVEPIQHFDPSMGEYAHLVEPPRRRKCEDVEFGCAYVQLPLGDALNGLIGPRANLILDDDNNVDFTIADSFVLSENGTVASVSFWVLDDDNDVADDVRANGTVFRVKIFSSTSLVGGCEGPDEANLLSEGVDGLPIVRAGQSAIWDLDSDGDDDVSRVTLNLAQPFMATAGETYWVEFQWDGDASDPFISGLPTFLLSSEGDGTYFQDINPAVEATEAVADGCPDADPTRNGYDCFSTEDDPATPDCDESDPLGDLEPSPLSAPPGEEPEPSDIALCISLQAAEGQTKDLPFDVACGSWRDQNGTIVWNQPFQLQDGGTIGFFSDIDFGADGRQVADEFTPRSDIEITGIHWAGGYTVNTPTQPDDFRVEFYADTTDDIPGNVLRIFPAAAPELVRVSGELSGDPGRQVFDYFFKLPIGQIVEANDTVWLSLVNNTTGAAYTWFWATSAGGDTNGVSAARDIEGGAGAWEVQPDMAGDDPADFAFDILVAGSNRIICGDAVDSSQLGTSASGLGYRFDSEFCYINGLQGKNLSESNGNRWNKVRAPWKFFNNFAPDGGPVPVDQAGDLVENAGISTAELSALTRNVGAEKLVAATFAGLAAYDAEQTVEFVTIGGSLDRLCNGAVVDEIDPNVALNDRFPVKGILWDNGTTTFIAGGGDGPPPVPPAILHANGLPGQTRPHSGYIDPREDLDAGPQVRTGLTEATMVFNTAVFGDAAGGAVTTGNFSIRETGGGTPPTITGVNCTSDTCIVMWDRPITLREWTTIEASVFNGSGIAIANLGDAGPGANEGDRIDLAALPCDVDQNGVCNPVDLFAFRGFIVNPGNQPPNGVRADVLNIDRDASDIVGPLDLFRFRQLVNGVSTPMPWQLVGLNNTRP